MSKIYVCDCTLRDGGYINDFNWGRETICSIIDGLGRASIDIIECGFIRSGQVNRDKSVCSSTDKILPYINKKRAMYVAMIQYGAISIDEITDCDSDTVDGIRLTFHEHEIEPAFVLGKELMNKGYKVFIHTLH